MHHTDTLGASTFRHAGTGTDKDADGNNRVTWRTQVMIIMHAFVFVAINNSSNAPIAKLRFSAAVLNLAHEVQAQEIRLDSYP